MTGDDDTQELRAEQLARERVERRLAETAPEDEVAAQHERRAEKAHYLREKLQQRAASEREVEESEREIDSEDD